MRVFTLKTPVRSMGDPTYTNFVDTVGEDCSGARQSLQLIGHFNNINDAVYFLFPPHVLHDPTACLQRAFLSPRNVFVDEFNEIMLDVLPGDYESYFSSDTIKEAEQVPPDAPEQTPDYLAMLTHPNTPPHRLDLKVRAVCAIQRSESVEKGLVRNARVCITNLHQRFVECRFLRQKRYTICLALPSPSIQHLQAGQSIESSFHCVRLMRRCSKGLTLEKTVLDLRTDSFAYGQLYTALSRVRGRRDIRALFLEGEQETTANVVYRLIYCYN